MDQNPEAKLQVNKVLVTEGYVLAGRTIIPEISVTDDTIIVRDEFDYLTVMKKEAKVSDRNLTWYHTPRGVYLAVRYSEPENYTWILGEDPISEEEALDVIRRQPPAGLVAIESEPETPVSQDPRKEVEVGKTYLYPWPDGISVAQYTVLNVKDTIYGVIYSNGTVGHIQFGCPVNLGSQELYLANEPKLAQKVLADISQYRLQYGAIDELEIRLSILERSRNTKPSELISVRAEIDARKLALAEGFIYYNGKGGRPDNWDRKSILRRGGGFDGTKARAEPWYWGESDKISHFDIIGIRTDPPQPSEEMSVDGLWEWHKETLFNVENYGVKEDWYLSLPRCDSVKFYSLREALTAARELHIKANGDDSVLIELFNSYVKERKDKS